MIENITDKSTKLAWTLQKISQETSLSVEFLRLEIKRGKLKRKKFGAAVRILNHDLTAYLNQSQAETFDTTNGDQQTTPDTRKTGTSQLAKVSTHSRLII